MKSDYGYFADPDPFITVQILKFDIDPIIYYKDMSLKGFYKT